MIASELQLRELVERLSHNERRTQALESLLLHEARFGGPAHETPTPGGEQTPLPPLKARKPTGRAEQIVASLDDVLWSASPDGSKVEYMAGGVERVFGRPAADFLARPGLLFDIAHDSDRDSLHETFRHLPRTGSFEIAYAVRTGLGSPRWVNLRGRLVNGIDGAPSRVDGIATDITAKVKTDRTGLSILTALGPRTGAELLNAAVEQLAIGLDVRAAVIAAAHPADPRTVLTLAAWVDGKRHAPFAFAPDGGFVKELLAGGSHSISSEARDRFPTDEFLDRLRAESALAVPLVAADGRLIGFVAIVDDRPLRIPASDLRAILNALAPRISVEIPLPPAASRAAEDRIREFEERLAAAEARARESSGFEAAGRLLAGAAHDFNNLLTLVTGHAELVRENLMADSPLCESMDVIASSGHTAARVARQLLAYSQPSSDSDAATLDPNAAIAESQMILAKLVGTRIELDLLLAPGVAPVRATRSDFDRVVLNLVSNAKDAIEDAGVIAVRTATATVPANRRGWPAECPPGEYVALTVTDTGCGMTEEVKDRVFNRFFTTKGEKGTGLGLATVRDIVRAAGGHVELESSVVWGTSVRVFWPAAADNEEPVSLSFEEALVACSE
jgi:signal transduction histidine kinase/PAS domain-containing protein